MTQLTADAVVAVLNWATEVAQGIVNGDGDEESVAEDPQRDVPVPSVAANRESQDDQKHV
jgi:hypothetical protein